MENVIGLEQALIGTAISSPLTAELILDVRPQDMSCQSHQTAWMEVIGLHRSGNLSVRGLIEMLGARGTLNTLGNDVGDGFVTGELYINEMLAHRSDESARHFADMVINASVKRSAYSFGRLLALDAESELTAEEILDTAEQRLFELRRRKVDTGSDIGDILDAFEEKMGQWRAGEITPAFKFSCADLAKIMAFMESQDFLIVAGRPGEGKSSWMRYEAFKAAQRGQRVVIFNLENGEIEYARYLIAFVTGINTELLRDPTLLSEAQVTEVKAAIKLLRSLPLRIVTLGAPSVREIVSIATKLVHEGFTAFFVDYLQLVRNGNDNIVQDISTTTSTLRGFALKHNVPVIAASQLNRLIVHRGVDAEPSLGDLRDSGSLEQDGVQVVFVRVVPTDDAGLRQFPENLDTRGNLIHKIRCIPMRFYVMKNRNGALGKTDLVKWDKATNNYTPLAME